jgi:hypothetical protein
MTTLQKLCQHLLIHWDIKENEFYINEYSGSISFKPCVTRRLTDSEKDVLLEDLTTFVLPAGIGIWFDSTPECFSPKPELMQMPDSAKQWLARWGRR